MKRTDGKQGRGGTRELVWFGLGTGGEARRGRGGCYFKLSFTAGMTFVRVENALEQPKRIKTYQNHSHENESNGPKLFQSHRINNVNDNSKHINRDYRRQNASRTARSSAKGVPGCGGIITPQPADVTSFVPTTEVPSTLHPATVCTKAILALTLHRCVVHFSLYTLIPFLHPPRSTSIDPW